MKNRRKQSSKPCSCGGTCDCHVSSKEKLFPITIPIFFPIIFPGLFPVLVCVILALTKNPEQHIQVDGQDCIIKYVNDHCTSTGACWGHNEAICPNKK